MGRDTDLGKDAHMAKRKRPASEQGDREQGPLESLPDRRTMEKALRQFAAGLGDERRKETPLDRAQEVIDRAFDAPPAKQIGLRAKH